MPVVVGGRHRHYSHLFQGAAAPKARAQKRLDGKSLEGFVNSVYLPGWKMACWRAQQRCVLWSKDCHLEELSNLREMHLPSHHQSEVLRQLMFVVGCLEATSRNHVACPYHLKNEQYRHLFEV